MKKNNEIQTEPTTRNKPTKPTALKKLGSAALTLLLVANVVGQVGTGIANITNEDLSPSYVVEECVDMPPAVDELVKIDSEEKQKKSTRMSVSGILSFVIAWLVSTVTNAFPHLLSAFLTPLGNTVFSWLLFAGGVILALAIALKKIFPNTPLKELLTKKRIAVILVMTAIIIIICEFAAYYLKEWLLAIKVLSLILGLVLILTAYHKIVLKLQ